MIADELRAIVAGHNTVRDLRTVSVTIDPGTLFVMVTGSVPAIHSWVADDRLALAVIEAVGRSQRT